jgi:adenylylsulfate kinase-like enzyme
MPGYSFLQRQTIASHILAELQQSHTTYKQVRLSTGSFLKVLVDAARNVCENHNSKGRYRRGRAREI